VSSTGGPAPTGPPPPARSWATKAGSTAHTFNITGSSGSGPGMKGRDCQVLLRSATLPLWASGFQPGAGRSITSGMVHLSRVRPDQQGSRRVGRAGRYGAMRLSADWLGRTTAESCPVVGRAKARRPRPGGSALADGAHRAVRVSGGVRPMVRHHCPRGQAAGGGAAAGQVGDGLGAPRIPGVPGFLGL
jgi:hypothetical protein